MNLLRVDELFVVMFRDPKNKDWHHFTTDDPIRPLTSDINQAKRQGYSDALVVSTKLDGSEAVRLVDILPPDHELILALRRLEHG